MLFHYTTDSNFERIIINKRLSLTRSTSSNDLLDTVYIACLLKNNANLIFEKIIKNWDVNGIDMFVNLINDTFAMLVEDLLYKNSSTSKTNKCFVICFTDKKDSRFLWETYAGDKGVTIGIEQKDLEDYISYNYSDLNNTSVSLKFMKVIYDEKEQIKLLKKISSNIFNNTYINTKKLSNFSQIYQPHICFEDELAGTIDIHPLSVEKLTLNEWLVNFMNKYTLELLKVAPFIKHPYWKEENEYRLCVYRPIVLEGCESILKFTREKTNSDVDYINIPINYKNIKKIIVGPLSKFNDISNLSKLPFTSQDIKIEKSIGINVKTIT